MSGPPSEEAVRFGCAFAVACIKFVFVFVSGMRAGHPVQRPISDQRYELFPDVFSSGP